MIVLDPNRQPDTPDIWVRDGDRTVRLTPQEARLIDKLMRNPHNFATREELTEAVWAGRPRPRSKAAVDCVLIGIRAKLPDMIVNVHGRGWRLNGLAS